MTVVKIDTIGTGVTTTYKTVTEWWSAVTSANSSNLVADDRILIGQLTGGNHHLGARLDMSQASVTVDANRYVILGVEDSAKFSGIIPTITNDQTSLAFVTGNIPEWFNCSVPYTQFKDFVVRTVEPVSLSLSNYFFNLGNTGIIDSVGFIPSIKTIHTNNTGIKFDFDLTNLYQGSTIRNSVLALPCITISGILPRSTFRATAVKYDDTCKVYNNTVPWMSGAVHLDSTSRDTARLELYGIRENFSPDSISGCRLWYDFDDKANIYNTFFNTLIFNSGDVLAKGANKAVIGSYDAIQTTTNRAPRYYPNYIHGRSVMHCEASTHTSNGSGLFIAAMFAAHEFDRGYTFISLMQLLDGGTTKTIAGTRNLQQPIFLTQNTNLIRNELTAVDVDDFNPGEFTENFSRIGNVSNGVNPFRVYGAIVDPSGTVSTNSGWTGGEIDFDASGSWPTSNFNSFWIQECAQIARDADLWYMNGRLTLPNGLQDCPRSNWGEVLFYNRPLYSGELNRINKYLINKWQLEDYQRTPNDYTEFVTTTGNVYNNYVNILGPIHNTLSVITQSYSIPHDDYAYNSSNDRFASGLFPNNIHYTGYLAADNFISVDYTGYIDARIKSDAPLRAKGTNLSSEFNYDIDGLPRYNWDIGADEYLFTNNQGMTCAIIGNEVNSGNIPLYLLGHQEFANAIDLYLNGYETDSGNITLYSLGAIANSSDITLAIHGFENLVNNIPLHLHGHETLSNNCSLYTIGHQELGNNPHLYINGHENQNTNLPLFIWGNEQLTSGANLVIGGYYTDNNDLNLYVGGHALQNNDIPLNIVGHQLDSGLIDLFIQGHESNTNSIPLNTIGRDTSSEGLTLFTSSLNILDSNIPLNIKGFTNHSGHTNLFIQGNLNSSGSRDLFIGGRNIDDITADLYIAGLSTESGVVPLGIIGHDFSSAQLPLSIDGALPSTGQIPIYILGNDLINNNITLTISGLDVNSANQSIPLSVLGYNNIEQNVDLFVGGREIFTNQIPLWEQGSSALVNDIGLAISGDSVIAINNNTPLFIPGAVTVLDGNSSLWIYGHDNYSNSADLVILGPSIVVTSSNVRNCVFNFNIPDVLINLHEEVSTAMLTSQNIGADCMLYYPPKKNDCPNCEFNSVIKKSANIYTSGGPVPFVNGTICPYCNGVGFVSIEASDTVRMKIYWNPKDWIDIGFDVQKANGVIQTQALTADVSKIQRSNYMVPNLRTASAISYKYKLIRESVPHGFRQDKFFISFWERV